MKIAFLTPEYPDQAVENTSGGIGTSIYNLAKGLIELGQSVTILVYNQSRDEILKSNKCTIYKIKNVKFKGLSWWLTRKKIEKLINKLFKENKIDIVEAPDWTGMTSFVNLNCPTIIKLHGSDTYFCHLENRSVKRINKFLEKNALLNADAHISVSQYAAQKTNEIFDLNIDFKIIPNSIDTEFFKPTLSAKAESSGYKILYVGTLIRKKGCLELPHIFNEVIKKVPDAELLMVGNDTSDIKTGSTSTYDLMKQLFSSETVNKQKHIGKIPYKEVKEYIEKADVIVFPSFIEALPLSWLEAMAMKKVIVASHIGWAKEIINHGKNGYMHNPKNHKEFANSIIDVLLRKVDVEQISSNARSTITKRFSSAYVAQENFKFYKQIVNED